MLSIALRDLGVMSSSSRLAPTTHDKFNGKEYLYGTADSLERFMCVSDLHAFRRKQAEGKQAIIDEFNTHGTAEDKECLNYILYEEAGSSAKTFQDGLKRDCDKNGNVLRSRLTDRAAECFFGFCFTDGTQKRGMRFEDFVAIGEERGIQEEHVLALRLYTTKAYQSINTQLRGEGNHFHFL